MKKTARRRVLVVASSYFLALPADAQRTRQLAWTLPQAGWDLEILSPGLAMQNQEWIDLKAGPLFPEGVPVHEGPELFRWLFRLAGVRGLAWRCVPGLWQVGYRLLRTGRFDLVYISTAKFNLFCLGRLWRWKTGVPYVLDWHDPWYRPGKVEPTSRNRLKFRLTAALARVLEPFAVMGAAGMVSVSPKYLETLSKRYPGAPSLVTKGRAEFIPFGFLDSDWVSCRKSKDVEERAGGRLKVVYVGVGGRIMSRSFRALAEGIGRVRASNPALVERIQIQLYGTQGQWKEGEEKILYEEAVRAGVGDLVFEDPRIIPYREAVERASGADGLLVLGVDDPGYMPSKLFHYLASRKPVLACLHDESEAGRFLGTHQKLGYFLSVGGAEQSGRESDRVLERFLADVASGVRTDCVEQISGFSAQELARKHVRLFESVLDAKGSFYEGLRECHN